VIKSDVTIFIVDDDTSVLKALKRLIMSAGFNVREYSSAHSFLNCGYEKQAGVLILDVQMPEMSGIEVQQKVFDSGSKMPIIFITAHENEEIQKLAMEAGAVAFLQKPVEENAILSAISKGLEKSHWRDNTRSVEF
jgi:FixJ family two-component response regulator